jgi:predicted membrane-bound mannosyltransferase
MSIVTDDWTMARISQDAPASDAVSVGLSRRATERNTAGKWATAIILIGSVILIFTRLGHYALWDDEAITAMTARGVWRTGDTSAWADDHNLVAYRNGLLINHFADRYTPPLQFYLLAPFMGLLGESNFVCRLPFAICGVITVGLMLQWLWRMRPEPVVWWAAAFLILTNASFFLFQRNCRYYALATVLSVAVAYLYYRWNSGSGPVRPLAIALTALLAAQYLNYAAAIGCLTFD